MNLELTSSRARQPRTPRTDGHAWCHVLTLRPLSNRKSMLFLLGVDEPDIVHQCLEV